MVDPVNASDLESLFDPARKPMFAGKSETWWHEHGIHLAERSAFVAESDCRGLVATVLELQRDDYWRKFSSDWAEFCQSVFGRPAAWIEQVVQGVRVLYRQQPERFKDAVPSNEALAQMAKELEPAGPAPVAGMASPNPEGVNQYTERNDGDRQPSSERGTTQRNIIRRIKRDHPEIAEQLERGEFPSARAAGLAAGFIKPSPPTVRLVAPEKVAAQLIARMGDEWAAQLTTHLTDLLTAP